MSYAERDVLAAPHVTAPHVTERREQSRAFDVWHEVPLVHQETGMSCWAAAAAMLIGWRDSVPVDPKEVAAGAGRWRAFRDGLLPDDVDGLARAWQLEIAAAPPEWTVDVWLRLLEGHGPLWVGEASPGLHSIVVTGMHGDGTDTATWIRINDPWPIGRGERYALTFAEFRRNFGAARRAVGPHAQVLHAGGRRRGRSRSWHREEAVTERTEATTFLPIHSEGDDSMSDLHHPDDYGGRFVREHSACHTVSRARAAGRFGDGAGAQRATGGAEWIQSTESSALELIADAGRRRHFQHEVDWSRQHFRGRGPDSAESEALFDAMGAAVPERRVPHTLGHRDVGAVVAPLPGSRHALYPEARDSFARMAAAAATDGVPLRVLSAWRSAGDQERVRRNNPDPTATAPHPSAHLYGLAVDLALGAPGLDLDEATTRSMENLVTMYRSPAYKWMAVHGAEHGWYPYRREPWHWEYNPPGLRERFGAEPSSSGAEYGAPYGLIQSAAAPDPYEDALVAEAAQAPCLAGGLEYEDGGGDVTAEAAQRGLATDTFVIGGRDFNAPQGLTVTNWRDANVHEFRGRTRDFVNELVIHETVTRSRADTVSVLRRRNLGVHLIVEHDGTVTQHGDLLTARLAHAGPHNALSVGIEVVNPYYPRNLPRSGSPWTRTIDARWAHEGRYVVPTQRQAEAVCVLTRWLVSPEAAGLDIRPVWLGYDAAHRRMRMGRLPNGAQPNPGVYAHHYFGHADGAWLVLYAWLRLVAGLDSNSAYERAIVMATGAGGWIDVSAVAP